MDEVTALPGTTPRMLRIHGAPVTVDAIPLRRGLRGHAGETERLPVLVQVQVGQRDGTGPSDGAAATAAAPRAPMDVVFVLDCSGSMAGEPLAQAKQAIQRVLAELREGDTASLVSFHTDATTHFVKQTPAEACAFDLSSVVARDLTNMEAGIQAAAVAVLGEAYVTRSTEALQAQNANVVVAAAAPDANANANANAAANAAAYAYADADAQAPAIDIGVEEGLAPAAGEVDVERKEEEQQQQQQQQQHQLQDPPRLAVALLLSDGHCNRGCTDLGTLQTRLEKWQEERSFHVCTIGIGRSFNSTWMTRLAKSGNGSSSHVSQTAELEAACMAMFELFTAVVARNMMLVVEPGEGVRLATVRGSSDPVHVEAPIKLGKLRVGGFLQFIIELDVDTKAGVEAVHVIRRLQLQGLAEDPIALHTTELNAWLPVLGEDAFLMLPVDEELAAGPTNDAPAVYQTIMECGRLERQVQQAMATHDLDLAKELRAAIVSAYESVLPRDDPQRGVVATLLAQAKDAREALERRGMASRIEQEYAGAYAQACDVMQGTSDRCCVSEFYRPHLPGRRMNLSSLLPGDGVPSQVLEDLRAQLRQAARSRNLNVALAVQ